MQVKKKKSCSCFKESVFNLPLKSVTFLTHVDIWKKKSCFKEYQRGDIKPEALLLIGSTCLKPEAVLPIIFEVYAALLFIFSLRYLYYLLYIAGKFN